MQKTKTALPNTAMASANQLIGVTLVPVADGEIVHSNSIKPVEMHGAMMQEQTLIAEGLTTAQAAAAVKWALAYFDTKAMIVEAVLPTVRSVSIAARSETKKKGSSKS